MNLCGLRFMVCFQFGKRLLSHRNLL